MSAEGLAGWTDAPTPDADSTLDSLWDAAANPDDLAASLEDALDQGLTLPRDEHGAPMVDDEGSADWALRKLAAVRERAAAVNKLADDQVSQVEHWRSSQLGPLSERAAFFEGLLTGWHRRLLDADPRPWVKKDGKTVTLPHGTLVARAGRGKVVVDDEDVLVAWLRHEAPELVTVVEVTEWSKAALKTNFAVAEKAGRLLASVTCIDCDGAGCEVCGQSGRVATGEAVPGVRVEGLDPTYGVQT